MKNLRWSPALTPIGLATLAAVACIDTGSLVRPTGAGGTTGMTAGTGGTTGLAGRGGASGGGGTGGTTGIGGASAPAGRGGTMPDRGDGRPSCEAGGEGLSNCGPSSESCCISLLVPGGTFLRSYDGVTYTNKNGTTQVGDFRLDKYEVTVGRFRTFKAAWDGGWRPPLGAGKHAHLNGGSGLFDGSHTTMYEQGWLDTWTANVAPTDAHLECSVGYRDWTRSKGANENRPANCVNWYEAYAFCIWDGGFLPSEAEWNYAASGGNEQRAYAWSTPPTSSEIDCSRANYRSADYCVLPGTGSTNDVGSESPQGDGKYGQADLGGNVWEWVLDGYAPYDTLCRNCTYPPGLAGVIRGGGLDSPPGDLLVSRRNSDIPPGRSTGTLGFRCARTPTGAPSTGIKLVPDTDGTFDGSNAAGVVGAWWSTGDFYGADTSPGSGLCPMAGFPPESCSMLTTPTPGAPFRPDPGGRGMCTTGVSAQILNGSDGQPAYSSIWGNIIGFALASTVSRDAGSDTLGVYDAPAHGITGFAFDIDAVPPGGHIRVTFPTKGTENNAAYWRGATNDLSPIIAPGHYEMRWPEIGGPIYLVGAPPFDPTTLEMISFHVVSNSSASTSYSFCVNNITLLTN